MGKRKSSQGKKQASKKPHIEKENSLSHAYDTFVAARGQELEKEEQLKKQLDLFVKTRVNAKSPATIENKNKETEGSSSIDKAFQAIIHAALIHLTNHVDESLEGLDDLLKAWNKSTIDQTNSTKDTKLKKNNNNTNEEEPAWADVAVDAVISMLLTCNNPCLNLFLQGIKKIANYTTENIVESICEPLIGVCDQVEEDEDEDDDQSGTDESQDSESDGDINEEMDEDASDDEDAWEDMKEEEAIEEEGEVKEIEKLKAKLQSILYSDSTGKSSESKNIATHDDEESEDEVDDETMFALDDAIAAAFKEKFASKKSVLDGKEELFKCRLLKIIQCYTCQRERKSDILIPFTSRILPLVKVARGDLKSKLIETLGEIFVRQNKKITPTKEKKLVESLESIFKQLVDLAGKAKNSDESTLYANGLNWTLKMDGTSHLTNALAELNNPVTLTSNTFVSLSLNCFRTTALQLLKLMVNGLISEEKDIQVKPLQLAHAFEIISHALAKFVNNAQDELPSDVCKQVCKIAKDKASQLTGHLNDGKCNWLLVSSVLQVLNYLKIIHGKDENNFFLPNDDLLHSLGNISGKNRKKLPKAGQIALKNLLNVSKKKPTPMAEGKTNDKNTGDENELRKKKSNESTVKSKIPIPKGKVNFKKHLQV